MGGIVAFGLFFPFFSLVPLFGEHPDGRDSRIWSNFSLFSLIPLFGEHPKMRRTRGDFSFRQFRGFRGDSIWL